MSDVLVFPTGFQSSIDKAVAAIPVDGKGGLVVGATKQGVEFGVAWKPSSRVSLGGYAEKLWGGGWDAGVKATVTW